MMRKANSEAIWRSSIAAGVVLILSTSFHCLEASKTQRRSGSGQIIPARGLYPPSALANGQYPSPDKQYLADAIREAPNTLTLTIIEVRSRKTILKDEVGSFVWVPNHPHCLVAAKCGPFSDKALLGMWEGGSTWRNLLEVSTPRDELQPLGDELRNAGLTVRSLLQTARDAIEYSSGELEIDPKAPYTLYIEVAAQAGEIGPNRSMIAVRTNLRVVIGTDKALGPHGTRRLPLVLWESSGVWLTTKRNVRAGILDSVYSRAMSLVSLHAYANHPKRRGTRPSTSPSFPAPAAADHGS